MTNDSHTPGPWTVLDVGERGFDIAHDDGRGRVVANTDNVDMTDECNARLIAAAPDLLDAAKLALQLCEEAGLDNTVSRSLDIVRDAINKATGR